MVSVKQITEDVTYIDLEIFTNLALFKDVILNVNILASINEYCSLHFQDNSFPSFE